MIVIAEEVQDAQAEGRPVVALESTIIAHGLPYPDNLALARKLEGAIREEGAVPATICVRAGKARVGLSESELAVLASPDGNFSKAGALDLAAVMAGGQNAATTVSATSSLAAATGIRLFATGGIGGVHKGAFDVSADLISLSRTPVAVVSAGPKAILDLPLTAEALESLAVLVLGYGTNELPAFYCRESGIFLEHQVDSPEAAAKVLAVHWEVLNQGGVLIANPAPQEVALPRARVDLWIQEAQEAADAQGVHGKAVTPFLLQFLARYSGGEAVATNCSLALNNARIAAKIACALHEEA